MGSAVAFVFVERSWFFGAFERFWSWSRLPACLPPSGVRAYVECAADESWDARQYEPSDGYGEWEAECSPHG